MGRSIDLVSHSCRLIENLFSDNNVKGKPNNKLNMTVKIFEKLGHINRKIEFSWIMSLSSYIHLSGTIKKVKAIRKMWNVLKSVVGKK